VATAGLLTTLISPLGRTSNQGHKLGSWTYMASSVSNITGQPFSLSFKTNKQRPTSPGIKQNDQNSKFVLVTILQEAA